MGTTREKQAGNTLIIVIVIVISLALITALGFIFWQNFIGGPKNMTTSESETSIVESSENIVQPEELTGSYSLPVENLYFQYPGSWDFVTKYKNNNGNVDNRTLLVSPNNFALEINIASYGPNWPFGERPLACPFDEGYNASTAQDHEVCPEYATLFTSPSSNLPGNSVYIFKTTYPKSDELKDSIGLTFAKDRCIGLESALCERPSVKTGYYLYVNGNYYEEITAANREEGGMYSNVKIKQMNDEEFIRSQDVQTAIAILKSVKYKN